ncbi:MAG: hypothetical protein U9N44_04685 [Chloroflexota bacterium]|nr:hypothetical protein [Chloroflexota bacterium]
MFEIFWTDTARAQFMRLKADHSQAKRYKAVKKTFQLIASNPRYPGLRTHEFSSLKGPTGEKIFESYAEQKTPAAYRIFWYYGPDKDRITIVAITPHP